MGNSSYLSPAKCVAGIKHLLRVRQFVQTGQVNSGGNSVTPKTQGSICILFAPQEDRPGLGHIQVCALCARDLTSLGVRFFSKMGVKEYPIQRLVAALGGASHRKRLVDRIAVAVIINSE